MSRTANHGGAAAPRPSWWQRQNRGQRRFIVITVAAMLLALGGLVGASWVKSPEQLALEQRPPPPSPVLVDVVEQTVEQTVVSRGAVEHGQVVRLSPPPAPDNADSLVTDRRHAAGDQVQPGDVLVEVAGRPVMVLQADGVMYRDIEPGSEGADVQALQSALRQLGQDVATDGVYGPATQQAVEALYRDRGYEPATTGIGQQEQLEAAEATVRGLHRQVEDLEAQRRTAASAVTPGPDGDPSPSEAAQDPAATEGELARAQEDLARARRQRDQIAARTGVVVPRHEIVLVPSLPVRVATIEAVVGEPTPEILGTLAIGEMVVRSRLRAADGQIVRTGDPATITHESTGREFPATVRTVGNMTRDGEDADDGEPSTFVPVIIDPDEALPPEFIGQNLLVTITVQSSGGTTLAVPQTAITTRADGQTYVTRVDDPRGMDTAAVAVATGISGAGMVEVRPTAGTLEPGDQVLVSDRVQDPGS